MQFSSEKLICIRCFFGDRLSNILYLVALNLIPLVIDPRRPFTHIRPLIINHHGRLFPILLHLCSDILGFFQDSKNVFTG